MSLMIEDGLHRHVHARHYRSVIDDANRLIQEALTRFGEPVAVALSGGKDSVCMAHLVSQHCRPLIVWNDSGLELPESEGIVKAVCEQLGLDLAIAKGDAMGIKIRKGRTEAFRTARQTDQEAIIAPVLSVLSEHRISCNFVGLRAAESPTRKMVIAQKGPVHTSKRWARGVAWPMRNWTASDCYAYMDEHQLPVHPAYTRTQWAHGDRNRIRVSWVWDSTRENQGDLEYMRRFYPQIYRQLRSLGLVQ